MPSCCVSSWLALNFASASTFNTCTQSNTGAWDIPRVRSTAHQQVLLKTETKQLKCKLRSVAALNGRGTMCIRWFRVGRGNPLVLAAATTARALNDWRCHKFNSNTSDMHQNNLAEVTRARQRQPFERMFTRCFRRITARILSACNGRPQQTLKYTHELLIQHQHTATSNDTHRFFIKRCKYICWVTNMSRGRRP